MHPDLGPDLEHWSSQLSSLEKTVSKLLFITLKYKQAIWARLICVRHLFALRLCQKRPINPLITTINHCKLLQACATFQSMKEDTLTPNQYYFCIIEGGKIIQILGDHILTNKTRWYPTHTHINLLRMSRIYAALPHPLAIFPPKIWPPHLVAQILYYSRNSLNGSKGNPAFDGFQLKYYLGCDGNARCQSGLCPKKGFNQE